MTGPDPCTRVTDPRADAAVVVAPDKFKGCLSAEAVAGAIGRGLRRGGNVTALAHPVADGGEGTVDALIRHGFQRRTTRATGPRGGGVRADYAVRDDVAVVELAAASGLHLLAAQDRRPLEASTYGTGEVITAAIAGGAREVIVGTGGSATTDGGAGMLAAMGARLLDTDGTQLEGRPHELAAVARVDLAPMRRRLDRVRLLVATDVTNPLLGELGAASVFGPQKGAGASDVAVLEDALAHWADVLETAAGRRARTRERSGAAGGASFGLMAATDARAVSGIELFLELSRFAERAGAAQLIITGEGQLDGQSLCGKAPYGVAQAGRNAGVPVVAVVGRNVLDLAQQRSAGFCEVHDLTLIAGDADTAIADAAVLLEGVGATISHALDAGRPACAG